MRAENVVTRSLRPLGWDLGRIRAALPQGGLLPDSAWQVRQRWIVRILWAHVVAIVALAYLWDYGMLHGLLEASIVAALAVLASQARLTRAIRSVAGSFGLLSCSAILVHLSGGYIEMHFHFFVMIIIISLYHDWTPFLIAIGYVVVHHGVFGFLDPGAVYNHPDAVANPWKWALIHGAFILGASAASMVSWRLSEDQLASRIMFERRARQSAEEALRLREEFLSVATHELRTPVTSIKGYAQLALRAARGDSPSRAPRLQEMLYRLDEQCDRLARLVTQLLEVSRIQSGKVVLEVGPTDIDEVLRRVVDVARQQTELHDVRLHIGPVPRVEMDAGRIEQVVTNLLDNAIRYSPSGGVIDVNASSDEHTLRISVSDEGIGIGPEHIDHIFDRYYQAHRREQRGGLGLGLYISREIVRAHGGDIVVEVPEVGTRFTVILPLALAPKQERIEARGPEVLASARQPVAAPVQGGRTVLVVEDEAPIRSILKTILADEGYHVLTAGSGLQALEVVATGVPDLIILDKLMPEMDGTSFAREYRARPGAHAPILALCAARDAEAWAKLVGAAGWASKPFDVARLLSEVTRVLEVAGAERSIHSTS